MEDSVKAKKKIKSDTLYSVPYGFFLIWHSVWEELKAEQSE